MTKKFVKELNQPAFFINLRFNAKNNQQLWLFSLGKRGGELLPDAPPFYSSGNFREKFASQFLRNAKEAKRVLSKRLDFDSVFLSKANSPEINHRSTLSLSIDSDYTIQISGENHSFKKLGQLIPAIFKLNPDHLPDYQPSVAAFHKILFASLHLIANGNVVPQIVQLSNKDYIIRWVPALIDSEVRLLTEKLEKLLPPDLLLSPKTIRKAEQLLPLEKQTNELLSIMISKLVAHLSRPSNGDLFEDLFFKNKAYSFSGVGENALSGGVKVWLDRFHLTAEHYKPVITVSELENEQFDVQISIEDTSGADQLPVPVSKILQEKQYETNHANHGLRPSRCLLASSIPLVMRLEAMTLNSKVVIG